MNLISQIKQKITLADAYEKLQVEYIEGSCRCPFPDHDDSNPSCLIRGDWFRCYGCGRHGDVIDFVEGMMQCDKAESIEWLVTQFNLWLPECKTIEELHKAIHALRLSPPQPITVDEKKRFLNQLSIPINRLWELYLERWQGWAMANDWAVWHIEVDDRMYKVNRWALYRERWPGVLKIREGYNWINELAIQLLRDRHRANLWAELKGYHAPKLVQLATESERSKIWVDQFCRAIIQLRDEFGVAPADVVEKFDPEFANKIRLCNAANRL